MARILVVVGHPIERSFCEALGDAYARGAQGAGHHVEVVKTALMTFDPVLRTGYREVQPLEPDLVAAHEAMLAAEHLVFIFPLWLGSMPALMKGFLERILQPDIIEPFRQGKFVPVLQGKSARIMMTMGMPGLIYRWYYGAHALKLLKRNILGFVGVSPIRTTIHGMIEQVGDGQRRRWLDEAEALGREAK